MSRAFRPMLGSFLSYPASRTWIRSRASRPPFPSSKKRRQGIRARPSARSRRFTTICASFGRGSASRIRQRRACRSKAKRSAKWSIARLGFPKDRRFCFWPRSFVAGKANIAKSCWSCARRAFSACASTARSMRSTRRPRSTKRRSMTSTWWSIASLSAKARASG